MGRKNSCKSNKPPAVKVKVYDVAFQHGERVERVEVTANKIDTSMDTLLVWLNGEVVGEFREWIYYVRLDDLDDETEIVENVVLPKDCGKLK